MHVVLPSCLHSPLPPIVAHPAVWLHALRHARCKLHLHSLLPLTATTSASRMQVLRLARCELHDAGGAVVLSALRSHPCVRELDLSWNALSHGTAKAVEAAFRWGATVQWKPRILRNVLAHSAHQQSLTNQQPPLELCTLWRTHCTPAVSYTPAISGSCKLTHYIMRHGFCCSSWQ
jgi:hypothetical protein